MIARDQHLPALHANSRDFDLRATASRQGNIDGVHIYDDLTQMLAGKPTIAVLSICAPPAGRDIIAREAIAAGLHFMLEKPPLATLGGLAALQMQAMQAGATLFTIWYAREASAVRITRKWLSGRRISAVRVHLLEDIRVLHAGQVWILAAGRFGVFDPAINAFSILTLLLSEPIAVVSCIKARPRGRDAPIAAEICTVCGDAAVNLCLDFLHVGEPRWDIEIDSDGHTLCITQGGNALSIDGTPQPLESVSGYTGFYRQFATLIAARKSEVDASPLRAVTDALLTASWRDMAVFEWNT